MSQRKLVYGRLMHDALTDRWSLLDQDGQEHQIQLGERVNLGTMYGLAVYGVLVAAGATTAWALTEIPSKPVSGAYGSIWRSEDGADAGAAFAGLS